MYVRINGSDESALSPFLPFALPMENESEPPHMQQTSEKLVNSIETDGKGDTVATTDSVSDEQWRSMMDVVMAIYEFREAE
ncbi:hypothetical protein EYZ11_005055 [Aspergillus tanneri]|uniref:Uncharacterized protein n=1 Tax=Aspergillus tanneri TaxID=1220188 RepID=A0A4S3JPS1_9EURO|nr:hypothetical protein EYZ11_005055 [Aspergillus tanneri]